MATQSHGFDAVSDYILSKIDIHVSGACGPGRTQPIECFYPVHQAYSADLSKKHAPIDLCMEKLVPGGVPRPVESVSARKGYGLVYDRDLVTTWWLPNALAAYQIFFWEKEFEAALGRNTMFIILEAFFDAHQDISDDCNAFDLMQSFRSFVEGLGTRMVSITVSSIVFDMIASFRRMKNGLNTDSFAWEKADLVRTLHEFVLTRECWQYAQSQEPALEVNFGVMGGYRNRDRRQVSEEIILQFHYSWNPPTIGFVNLQNVVFESTNFILKPSARSSRPYSELERLEVEYYVGGTDGTATPALGAQRLDAYTLALELTTRITKHFPGGIKYETITRCAIPLTVKRQPDACKTRYRAMTQLPSPLRSMLPMAPRPDTCDVEVRIVRDITLHSEIEEGSSKGELRDPVCTSQPRWTRYSTPCRDMGTTKVNRRGDLGSDSEAGSPDPTPRAVSILLSPEKQPLEQSPIRRRALLRSERSSPELMASRPSQKLPCSLQRDSHRSPVPPRSLVGDCLEELSSQDVPVACGPSHNRKPLGELHNSDDVDKHASAGRDSVFRNTTSASSGQQIRDGTHVDSVRGTPQCLAGVAQLTEDDVKEWQREIQRNYQESLENKENAIMMEAEAWSDEE